MRINEIRNKEVDVTLDSDELVKLCNIMYFYETNQRRLEPGNRKPDAGFHELNASMIVARDLSQYGNLDSFSLKSIVQHKVAANPDSRLAEFLEGVAAGCGKEMNMEGAQERMAQFLESLGTQKEDE